MWRSAHTVLLAGSCLLLLGAGHSDSMPATVCTPSFFELDRRVSISADYSELSFRMLAIGCKEGLGKQWPPSHDAIEQALRPELLEPHPVQILLMIRDRDVDLRARLVARLNERVFGGPSAYDVFLFDAEAAEH